MRAAVGFACTFALAAGLTACASSGQPPAVGGYPTAYASGVPADILAAPHVWYGGGYAYLVGDQWYYPARGRWVVLRDEPPELNRYRSTYRAPTPTPYRASPTNYGYRP
jgi:hypothetical protein